jgi:predicted Zn-dependent protease
MLNIRVLLAGAAVIALGSVAVDPGYAAKKTASSAQTAPAVPKPFSDKEKANGAKIHQDILKEFGEPYQSPQTAYVVKTGKKIALQTGLSNSENDFTVTFLNSAVNNAFAIEGGYMYITRQLVALCNSEAEMAGVLAHEAAHTAARHVKKRSKKAGIYNILGVLGTIGGAILGDSGGVLGALGGLARDYSGTLAQIFTLGFSREQEEQADDYGIRYLSKAGYDPKALSSMLNSLAMQSAIDQRAAGQSGGSIPEWASTHPDPVKRVARAAAGAAKYPVSNVRNADAHMTAIDGMMYDDDPKEGIIEGQEFLHRDMKIKFAVPSGFGMSNSRQAVAINGNGGKGYFTLVPGYNGNKEAYVAAAIKQLVGDKQAIQAGPVSETTVNGVPAFYAEATVPQQQGTPVKLTVFAYEVQANEVVHFITISPTGTNPFESMYRSFGRLSDSEAAAIKPRKIRVIIVTKSDSVASLAGKMAYKSLQTERFLALNGISANTVLTPGKKVKIVTY